MCFSRFENHFDILKNLNNEFQFGVFCMKLVFLALVFLSAFSLAMARPFSPEYLSSLLYGGNDRQGYQNVDADDEAVDMYPISPLGRYHGAVAAQYGHQRLGPAGTQGLMGGIWVRNELNEDLFSYGRIYYSLPLPPNFWTVPNA